MNIHAEREIKSGQDAQLIVRLMGFAKPYWKMILFCILLAFIIVISDLARPYIIKVAIDEHINGLERPMLAVPAQEAQRLKTLGAVVEWENTAYVRLSAEDAAKHPA